MAKKLLLCASAFHLSAGVWSRGRLAQWRSFEDDPDGHAAFQTFLRSHAGVPVYLTADTVDEDYRFETLPHAGGKDRREMLERKLRQLYRSTPFYGAAPQARETDKRRDDRYLFCALTNADVFSPWLPLIMTAQAPIVGVFPLALVMLSAVKRLLLSDANLLLVMKGAAGIRQTFVRDEAFRISRLTPVEHSVDDSYAEEIRNTRMYLDALNITHVEDPVTIVMLDQDGSLAQLGAAVVAGRRNLRCVHVTPQELAGKTGVTSAALQGCQDALTLHLLGSHVPDLNLAPASLTAGYARLRMGRYVYVAAAAAGLTCATWAGANVWSAVEVDAQRQQTLIETQRQHRQYQEITRTFPPAPAGADRLQQTVEVAGRIAGLSRLPTNAYAVVSRALDANPAISLTGLTWKHGRAAGNTGAAPQLAQSVLVQAELLAQSGDVSGALAAVNKFVRDLGKQELVGSARAVKLPVNLGPGATLRGSTADARKSQPVPVQFDVEVVLKPEG